jgi:hypothetical protein
MRTTMLAVLAVSIALSGCNGQTMNKENKPKTTVPQTNIKVNKEYDKNGNLIRFDSSYSSYYSNIKGDSVLKDSIFNNFKSRFNNSYFFSNQPYFKDFFFADSLLKYDFYKKDFFYNRFRQNIDRMDSLFRGMDIVKNDFFNSQAQPKIKK